MALFGRNDSKKDEQQEPKVAPPAQRPSPTPAPAPAPAPVAVVEPPKKEPPTLGADGTLPFDAIYAFTNVPAAPFSAEQTLQMLQQLPDAMPLEMKRQTVQVTLGAMGTAIGATRESIVSDATRKRQSLQQYADAQGQKTNSYVVAEETEIAQLQQKIAEKEALIADAKSKQAIIRELCDGEANRLDSVLAFFEPSAASTIPTISVLPADETEDDDFAVALRRAGADKLDS